ncbi:hypothetical protein BCR23_10025 [Enterococcus quebecensis]|uniref:Uncharacterized protein n=2 Tax=Enterococcus quebecensis TaxID=903983 RepID=A0A1E5GR57_9ENTE|nr:hypothetical protein BCR23_10025 [Enterococcus quebecensis]
MIERRSVMKNKKRKWLQLLVLCSYFFSLTEMKESQAAENSKASIGFYEVDNKEQRLPKTGDDQQNKELRISGISILLFITGMISYRTLKNEERK